MPCNMAFNLHLSINMTIFFRGPGSAKWIKNVKGLKLSYNEVVQQKRCWRNLKINIFLTQTGETIPKLIFVKWDNQHPHQKICVVFHPTLDFLARVLAKALNLLFFSRWLDRKFLRFLHFFYFWSFKLFFWSFWIDLIIENILWSYKIFF